MKVYPASRGMAARTQTTRLLCTVVGLTLAFIVGATEVCAQTTEWVSKDSDGNEGNSWNSYPSISADGRHVAFESNSDNLVLGDTNDAEDIFVHDRDTDATIRVSVDSNGNEGNGLSGRPSISPGGRYVAFESSSDNLVAEDTNLVTDVFVHDRHTSESTLVSINSLGNQGNGDSYAASISVEGQYVAFFSLATNLDVRTSDTNSVFDIFVHDRASGDTRRVSVDSDGNQANERSFGPSISADGRYVAFWSLASNLVQDDTNEVYDIFVHDRESGDTSRVSVDSNGNEGNANNFDPSISANGRYVAFYSLADNLVADDTNAAGDVFVHDRETGDTARVSVDSDGNEARGDGVCSISADGRYVAFPSWGSNLVPNDTNSTMDVFVHDRDTGETRRVSIDSDGYEGNDWSDGPSISADGRYVAFESEATNLVPEDTYSSYWSYEIFVHGPLETEQLEVSVDIAPNRDPNRINPEHGRLAVAIITEDAFDATLVDPQSVRFGSDAAWAVSDRVADIDRDGDTDLVLQFQTAETGISCGDTEATLTGETYQGIPVSGTDAIVTMGCHQ